MAEEVWETITFNGKECWVVPGWTVIEKDPTGDVYVLVRTPDGSSGTMPTLARGGPGPAARFSTTTDPIYLDYDDPTPDVDELVVLDPGDEDSPQIVQWRHTVRRGPKGDDGDTLLTPSDYDDPAPGQYPAVNLAGDEFELVSPKVGDRYFPASIASVPTGQATYTLAAVSIPAQLFDWRPEVHASCEITGTGADVKVDLVARLGTAGIPNPETAGNIVGRALGSAGQYPPVHVMTPGPPAGSSNTHDRVLAGNPAVIYVRTERQTGIETYSTVAERTLVWVKVNAIP